MSITPFFQCSQDDTFFYVKIRVPNAKTDEMEFSANDDIFLFYGKPYFLRYETVKLIPLYISIHFSLYLPGKLVEDGRSTGTFDFNTNELMIKVAKAV